MGTAPPGTFTSPSGTPLSTTNQKTGQPHNCYKYLGVYIFTANHEAQTLASAKSEIGSFFTTLQPLRLTLSEYILLVNVQLISILSYCLMAHPLALNELGVLQAMIWQNIAHDPSPDKANRISRLFSPKARYTPRHQGGLGLRHFTFSICMALMNTAIRYLNGDGPASTNEAFSEEMLSTTRNPIQDTVMDACHTIGLRYHSTGLWASCPPSLFLPKEKVQVRFLATKPAPQYSKFGKRLKRTPQDLGFHLGTVTGVNTGLATLQFSDGTTHTIKDPGLHRNEKEYAFQSPAISVRPQLAGRHELLTPPPSPPPRVHPQPPPPPGHTAESYLFRHCMASCTGSQMNLTPLNPMTSKNGVAKQPLPSSTHRPPARHGFTWMAQRAPWATDLRPPCFFRMAPDGCCAKRPHTSPQRDRSSGRLLCSYGGPLHLTRTSPLPC